MIALLPEVLDTDRLTLRPYRFEDVDAVLSYAADEEWSRYLIGVPQPYQRSDALQFLARQALVDRAVHPTWAIVFGGTAVGGINIRFRFEHRVAEVGWSIHRRLWGQGLATEAARAVVDSAFRSHAQLSRVGATADLRNTASLRVMEKIGMRREGTLRQSRVSRGMLVDEAHYGLLRSEWEARQTS
jgi:RimJ/RimL family protein N-acetyltransferase